MSGMFQGVNKNLVEALSTILQGQTSIYGNMINTISVSSFTVFILLRGYQTIAGKLSKPFEEVVWDAGRAALILTFVLNIGGWLTMSMAAIEGLRDGVSGSDNVWVLLDSIFDKTQTLGQTLLDKDSSTYVKLSGVTGQILVWAGASFVFITGAFVNLLALITITLMTTTSPIFIFCLMYGFLRPMFNNWLQTIFTAILTIMFSSLSVRIAIAYINKVLDSLTSTAAESNIVTVGVQCLLAGIASAALIWFSSQLARALGGAAVQAIMQNSAANATKGAADLALKTGMGVSKAIPGAATAAGKGMDYVAQKGWDAYSSARMSSMLKNMSQGSTGSDMRAKRQASIDNMIKSNSRK